ncbi:MAG: hypothetical protein MJ252_30155, partial [archaeon]|nr:hypothetical protein [archaeon]
MKSFNQNLALMEEENIKSINKLKILSLSKFVDLGIGNDEETKEPEEAVNPVSIPTPGESYQKIVQQSLLVLNNNTGASEIKSEIDPDAVSKMSTMTFAGMKGMPFIIGTDLFNKSPGCGIIKGTEEKEIIMEPDNANQNNNPPSGDVPQPPPAPSNVPQPPPVPSSSDSALPVSVGTGPGVPPPPPLALIQSMAAKKPPPAVKKEPPKPVKPREPAQPSFQDMLMAAFNKRNNPNGNNNNQPNEEPGGIPKLPNTQFEGEENDKNDDIDIDVALHIRPSMRKKVKIEIAKEEETPQEESSPSKDTKSYKSTGIFDMTDENDSKPVAPVKPKNDKLKMKMNDIFGDEEYEDNTDNVSKRTDEITKKLKQMDDKKEEEKKQEEKKEEPKKKTNIFDDDDEEENPNAKRKNMMFMLQQRMEPKKEEPKKDEEPPKKEEEEKKEEPKKEE